jgi:alpha-tubulin suppressor-like RCC1 family protein
MLPGVMTRIALSAVLAVGLFACSRPSPPTELIVVISSDYRPVEELARVAVTTFDEAGGAISSESFIVSEAMQGGTVSLPFSLGIRPAEDVARPLRLTVEGFATGAAAPFVTRRATVPFVAGERRRLGIFLERACEQVLCASAEETCVSGVCVDRTVPVSALEVVVPGEELELDGGVRPPRGDAGPSCREDPACDEATQVEVGRGFACALRGSGRVACWGEAAGLGQLGNGGTEPSAVPVEVLELERAESIVAGDDFVCVRAEPSTTCWGANELGQLGRATPAFSAIPLATEVGNMELFAGRATVCGGTGGFLLCWGGALGIPLEPLPDLCSGVPCSFRPIEQPTLRNVRAIADEGHVCVVRDERVDCASSNTFGEVGDGTREPRTELTPVAGLALGWEVATTSRGSCAIDAVAVFEGESMSTLHCWGADDLGQVGDGGMATERCEGDVPCALAPFAIASVTQPIQLVGTVDTYCVRELAGRVLCWGSDEAGRLGDGVGAPDRCGDRPCARTPTPVRGLSDTVDLDARDGTFCAVRRSGGVVCWGSRYADLPLDVGPLP